jgi:DNA replication initiation complex subunit (GINS family)
MIVLTDNSSKLFEVDNELFEEVKNFLKTLSKKRKKKFTYIDDAGDIILVDGENEYVIPAKDDVSVLNSLNENDFIDEEEAKKLLNV